ncbi:MAG: L-threonylcarbamoyladenylate synthase [Candidatus Micrarchaeota archaeon]
MQIIPCPPYEAAIKIAKARLSTSGIIVYPTDTIYGIGCDGLDGDAIRRIREIKMRDAQKPFSLNFSSWEQAQKYVEIDETLKEKLDKMAPGPYTFLLPLKEPMPVADGMVLGCRIPDNEFCKQIGMEFENPIVSTSANVSGNKSPSSVAEIDERILKKADLVIDGGPTKYAQGSTIIDVLNKRILRRGAGEEKAQKWLESL